MRNSAIVVLIGFVLVTSAAAQGAPGGGAASPGAASKPQLSEVRTLVHELEGHTDKLRELMTQYRSLVEQRPEAEGSSPEAKKAHEAELARWNAAVERLLSRLDAARAAVTDAMQRLERSITGELPTGLAKDVARARNEAEAERATAEQVLAKSKASSARKSKPAKQTPATEKAEPAAPEDLDL